MAATSSVVLLKGGPDTKLCCFRDADMYVRDARLLLSTPIHPAGAWLNSSCINFGLRLLEEHVEAKGLPPQAVYLVDPSVSTGQPVLRGAPPPTCATSVQVLR